jgi:aspartyl-tRNA synthetase
MAKTEITSLADKVDKEVTFEGWVDSKRDHGNLIFLDIRDRSGIVQVVVFDKKLIPFASGLNAEDLIIVTGKVQKRPEKLVNPNITTGTIEVGSSALELITPCEPLPFEVNQDTLEVSEITRMKYRYLDLRSQRMRNNLEARHKFNHFIREYMTEKGFWEIETPCLTKGTPEGAREYIIPSRLADGKFFVLPQSPQQFKQLLMVGGIEKYYQIARCFRDEDQRGDRQPEFMQLDFEMSFTSQDELMALLEEMTIKLVKELYKDKTILQIPFPKMTYREAMEKFNSDKPDLREKSDSNTLAFCWIVDFPLFEYSDTEKKIVSAHHPFTEPVKEDYESLDKKPLEVRANSFDLVLNGSELGSGGMRINKQEVQHKIFEILGLKEKEIQDRFGHMLLAYKFSPPSHGGFGLGLDRMLSILQGEENIREVIAFPKTGDAKDPLMGAPSEITEQILEEDHIKVIKKAKK